MSHVALYCRISKDRSGRREGVDAQETWGRQYAAEHWPGVPVEVFSDNDLTGAREDVERPEFDRLREWIRIGKVAHLWTVEQSRLTRVEGVWFALVAELIKADIDEVHTRRDGIVRLDDVVGGIKAVLSANEVRTLTKRLRDHQDVNASNGVPPGGRVFGYEPGELADGTRTWIIDDEQAQWVRWAAGKVLAGWALGRIAAHLNEAGVKGTRGGRWTNYSVRKMLTGHSIAGYRVHRGQIVGDGNWEPILDRDTWRSVRAKLDAPRVVTSRTGDTYTLRPDQHGGSRGRRWLLSGQTGVGRCGVCGSYLNAAIRSQRNGGRVAYYACAAHTCVAIQAEPVEEHVRDQLLALLDHPAFVAALTDDGHTEERQRLHREMEGITAHRSELAQLWAADQLSGQEWAAARARLDQRQGELEARLAEVPPPVAEFDPALVRSGWDLMTLDERREIAGLFVEAVVIHPAKRGTKTVDVEGRIKVR